VLPVTVNPPSGEAAARPELRGGQRTPPLLWR